MPATNTSPNVLNYYSGRGIVKWKALGASVYRDVGNVPTFEYNANVTRMEHFSMRAGIRSRDANFIAQRTAALRIIMDEFTADNMALHLIGSAIVSAVPATDHYEYKISVGDLDELEGAVRFVGTNTIGPRLQMDIGDVVFAPGAALNLLQEQFGNIEISGDVNADPTTSKFADVYWNITQEINP